MYVVKILADYGICHNADFDLCGMVFECADRLWVIEKINRGLYFRKVHQLKLFYTVN